ncbi:MAG: biopolymer transporter ExbB [Deltaproteobacteria bacterium]|nr:MAG: biopolymer transporter ExbB [Deltaproteobacteria bacterium]
MGFFNLISDYFMKGGFVIYPIIITSVLMWALIFERLLWFNSITRKDIYIQDIKDLLSKGHISDENRGLRAFVLRQFFKNKTGSYGIDSRFIDEAVIKAGYYLDKNIAVITTLAAISPLFGLLGTVTGMIETFDVITFFGTGNPRAMAAGISEALVTTQAGLLVAIPGMFMSVFIARKSKKVKDSLNETGMMIKRMIK